MLEEHTSEVWGCVIGVIKCEECNERCEILRDR